MRLFHAPRVTVAAAFVACTALTLPIAMPRDAAAQARTNIVPDGGDGSIRGKIESVDTAARTVTIIPASGGQPVTLHAPANVNIAGYMPNIDVSAHFTRTVHISVVPPTPGSAAPTAPGATATVGQVAGSPGGFGSSAATVVANVVRVNGPDSVTVVNRTGGGEYTLQTTVPSRKAIIATLKSGDIITVSVSEYTLTSMVACGLLGCL